ncbi:tetratricopeptide repeat protein [Bradyrhizobium jicamae]|uniref:tetratricopeptide repeat protein n=1 Tax=Bradyrhizobium jicamae TaxID=280332 RepID=UPI001BA993DC|nr:tetratricopeptide repeat protein [Bradyrhizobium jicamae]MBR0938203.1 tetratricopeptide repeat protein [Bradyrhizobium jicamae]
MSGRQTSFLAQALQQGAGALRSRRFDLAERIAGDILKSNRTDRNAVLILAHALVGQDRAGEAIAPLERIARRSDDGEVETLLGALLCKSGRAADGIAQLRRTIARRPPYLPSFQELAGQLSKAGQLGEAISVIESGLALVPESVDLKVDLGRLLHESNEFAKALEVLTIARDAAPGRPDVLIELGRVLILSGDYTAAADAFRHVLAQRPDDGSVRAYLATCLLEQGERDAGEAALRAVMRGGPHLLGRAAFVMAASSHGRFFFDMSEATKFLGGKST